MVVDRSGYWSGYGSIQIITDPEDPKTDGSGTLPKSTVCCEKGPGQMADPWTKVPTPNGSTRIKTWSF